MARTFPVKDADFLAFALNIDSQCVAHEMDWNLNSSIVIKLHTLTVAAKAAYEANANPEEANRRTAAAKDVHFGELKVTLSTVVKTLELNEAVTEDDLRAMGLPSREHHFHEPLPEPTDAPETIVVAGQHHDVSVYVGTPQHGHPTEFLTKKGYYGFVVRYRKDDETDWHEEHTTRLHTVLYFNSEDVGKRITVTAAWINPRLQHGPWSDEIQAIVN